MINDASKESNVSQSAVIRFSSENKSFLVIWKLSSPSLYLNLLYKQHGYFLNSQGLGDCLDDSPTDVDVLVYPDLPAGAMYNADLQCRLQFNITDDLVKVCSKMDEICSQIWCLVNDECVTQLRPAAPGTNCGKHKVIFSIFHLFWSF